LPRSMPAGFRKLVLTALALIAGVTISACGQAGSLGLLGAGSQAHSQRHSSAGSSAPSRGGPSLTVQSGVIGPSMPNGFVGLSMEYRGLEAYLGRNPAALSPPFVQLLRNLAPAQRFVLRIGGDSSDWTWYPIAHVLRPGGVRYSLDPTWVRVARSLAQKLDARLILGINLEANSLRVASGEARALLGVGASHVTALELGNEPELYGSFNWYRTPGGVGVKGRPRGYAFANYLQDFSSFAHVLPPVPLAGPSVGGPEYEAHLGSFVHAEPRVRLVTLHAYPLKHCTRSTIVTPAQLLASSASAGLANSLASYVGIAHRHRVGLRIDELNAVSCGGTRGVSNAFVSSLWMLNTLFELARVGVDGINVHTVPGTINEVIGSSQVHGRWEAKVHPEYYGMMMFAQAAPPGSRLLRISSASAPGIESWATRAPDRHVRVVLINRTNKRATVGLRVAGQSGPASLERLQAPRLTAEAGVTLGGQSFGTQTSTGVLVGRPRSESVTPRAGRYPVVVPGNSAVLLTF